jgi:DNA-binding NarL/FixJ family response regulator
MHRSNETPLSQGSKAIDLLPIFNHSIPSLTSSLGWLKTSKVQWKIGLASSRRLLHYAIFHALRSYPHHLEFMVTTEAMALERLGQGNLNILILTPDLEQGNGNDLIQKALEINGDIYSILIVDLDRHDTNMVLPSSAHGILTEWELFNGDSLNQLVIALLHQRRYRSPAIKSHFKSMSKIDALIADTKQSLTKRELDVAKLLLEGANDREIANHLKIGYNTVRSHGRALRKKLSAQNRNQLLLRLQKILVSSPSHN